MTKKKETKEFDLEEALANVQMPSYFVEGFEVYIKNNNLKISSEKEFEKSLKEFGELKL